MKLINELLPLLFSFTGIVFGIILSYIAPEELNAGQKYFLFFERLLFLGISFLGIFFLMETELFAFPVLFAVAAFLLFVLTLKKRMLSLAAYLFLIIPYFFSPVLQPVLASLIFLYGLPVGTLIHINYNIPSAPGATR